MTIFYLAKLGYGSVDEIENWDSPRFLDVLEYENICNEIRTYEQDQALKR